MLCDGVVYTMLLQTIHGMNISWPTFTGSSLESSKVRKMCKFSSSKTPFSNPILEVQPSERILNG